MGQSPVLPARRRTTGAVIDMVLFVGFVLSLIGIYLAYFQSSTWASELRWFRHVGVVAGNLALAYLASYIFYCVVVVARRILAQRQVRPYVATKTKGILAEALHLGNNLRDRAEIPSAATFPAEEEVQEALKLIDALDRAPTSVPKYGLSIDWLQYLQFVREKTLLSVRDVLVLLPYLDVELVARLCTIQDLPFFWFVEILGPERPQEMDVLEEVLVQYFGAMQSLQDYHDEHLKKHEEDLKSRNSIENDEDRSAGAIECFGVDGDNGAPAFADEDLDLDESVLPPRTD